MKKNLTKKVIPTLDSNYAYTAKFKNIPVFNGTIENEVAVSSSPKCFGGAWYRKVFSAKDFWLGIEGVVELGEFHSDPNRFAEDRRIGVVRDLDNPSIYMGGFALAESDAGLGMNISYLTDDTSAELDYS